MATETNSIDFTCTCGRSWQHTYKVAEIKESIVYLARIVAHGSKPNDALCSCGAVADACLKTPMPGYKQLVVRLLVLERDKRKYSEDEQDRHYNELVEYFIEAERPINLDQIEAIEAKAIKILDLGFTPALWQALSPQEQAAIQSSPAPKTPQGPTK